MNLIHACPEVAMIYRRRKNTYQNTAVNNQGKKEYPVYFRSKSITKAYSEQKFRYFTNFHSVEIRLLKDVRAKIFYSIDFF